MGRSIVVTSGKGGTGKTSFVAGVSSCLAALGKTVICIDADVGLRNLDIALGLSDRAMMNFNDVMLGNCSVRDALVDHPSIPNLSLLSAPANISAGLISGAEFKLLAQSLATQVDFVFVDSSAGLDDSFTLAVNSCEEAIIVVTPDSLALRDGARAAGRLNSEQSVQLVVNRVRPHLIRRRLAFNIDDAMDTTGLPLLGLVPEDEMVMASANNAVPIVLASCNGAARAYLNIAKRLMGKTVELSKMRFWKMYP